MPVSPQAELDRIARWFMRDTNLGVASFTKPELVAAISALDTFLSTNETAINNAFPTAFRSKATTPQKAMLLAYVTLRRYGGSIDQGSD
jgi:hypothetical protein